LQKYFCFTESQIKTMIRHPVPHEGRIAIVTDVGMGCGGRGSAGRAELIAGRALARERSGSRKTSGAASGRQNRVVLAPVAGVKSAEVRKARPGFKNLESAGDGDKTNSSPGRARDKPLKPTRREGRV
jgi:hypothetical protein